MGFKNSTYIKALVCCYSICHASRKKHFHTSFPKLEMFVQKLIYLESDFVPSTKKIVSGKTGAKFIASSKEFKNIFMCIIVHTFQVREIHSIEGYILSLYHYLSTGLNS